MIGGTLGLWANRSFTAVSNFNPISNRLWGTAVGGIVKIVQKLQTGFSTNVVEAEQLLFCHALYIGL